MTSQCINDGSQVSTKDFVVTPSRPSGEGFDQSITRVFWLGRPDMTRRDWWLGIALIIAALAVNAVLTVKESTKVREAIEARFTPGPRQLATEDIPRMMDADAATPAR